MYFATTEFDGDDNAKLFPGLLHFSFLLLNVQAHLCVMREKESVFVCGLYSFIQFAGSKQSDRYEKAIIRLLKTPAVLAELEQRGIKVNDLGGHSTCKGIISYCLSGTTACPSESAISLRSLHSLVCILRTFSCTSLSLILFRVTSKIATCSIVMLGTSLLAARLQDYHACQAILRRCHHFFLCEMTRSRIL